MYIVIVGGGNVGYYLAKALSDSGHEVVLMEKDRAVHRTISEELGELVMQGDGCEVRLLNDAGAERADVVVAATGDDEDNLVICQMAKIKFSVPRTLARVNNPVNEQLFRSVGVDATVSSTKIIYNMIEQEIQTGDVIPLAALARGNVEIVQIEITQKCHQLRADIVGLELPEGALIISVIRNEQAMLPAPGMRFELGDSVIALVNADHEHKLRDIFAEASA